MLLLHRAADAVAAHGQAHALGLNVADAHYNRGNALQAAGRLDDAVQAYRQALVCEADHSLALYDLARLRWRLGDADFDDELLQASAASPASSVAPGVRAQLLMRAGRHADAAEAFEAALARAPSVAAFHDGLARCHARLGRFDHSLQAHRRALSLAPQDAALRGAHAMTLLMAKRPEQAAAEALATIELDPHDQMAPALLGLAWRVMGDPREAWLNDHARFVQVLDLAPPSGFDDMASFNEALRRELEALHVDRAAPVDQTLRHGTQTIGCIFEQRHALVDALKVRIAEAVDRFIAGLPEDAGHPFLRQRSTGWRFTDSWSSRLESGGFHTRHVHPHGWISSAYYVSVPPGIEASSTYEGWLELGAPDFECGLPEPVVRRVMPRAGRLVLFPSMVWHGTRPVHGPAARLSLAFDVRPR